MRIPIGAVIAAVAVAVVAAASSTADACELKTSPFEHREAAVAVADVVAGVVVDRVDDSKGLAYAHVTASLQGAAKLGDKLVIREMISGSHGKDACAMSLVAVGQPYVVILYAPEKPGGEYTSVYAPTAIVDTPAERAATSAAIAKKHPASAWTISNGIASRLVVAPASSPPPTPASGAPANAAPTELNLYLVVRNLSAGRIQLARKWWPLAASTACQLTFTGPGPVASTKVPIDDKDIASYFTTRDGAYTFDLGPGFAEAFLLPRVTTAAKGWGYKEELGFRYYPITTHGDYKVTASCPRWLPSTTITTGAVTVTL